MNITIDGVSYAVQEGVNLAGIVRGLFGAERYIMAMREGHRVVGLDMMPEDGASYIPVTLFESEGRRIYERSLSLLFIKAVEGLFPGAAVHIQHSLGSGQYITVNKGEPLEPDDIPLIEGRMRELVKADLPFERAQMTVAQAVEHFRAQGKIDKVRLLHYRPFDYFNIYKLDGMIEYFYGEMAPSTGFLSAFGLRYRMPGLVLLMPDRRDPSKAAPYVEMPKVARLFDEAERWGERLHAGLAADINEMIESGNFREFIRVNEALHEREIADIAHDIAYRHARVVLIAGPSSSGKTSFANRLYTQLRVEGLRPFTISLDDYYNSGDLVPKDEFGEYDYEALHALDVGLFNDNLVDLLLGKEVRLPRYVFKQRQRVFEEPVRISSNQPLIIEGIHGLNDELTADVPLEYKYRVYITPLQQLNLDAHNRIRSTDARILRRLVRDHQFRGFGAEETFSRWPSVRRGEEKWIYPFQEQADALFNSSLTYELAVLKRYAYPMLKAVPEDSLYQLDARRLIKFLNYFVDTDVEDEIPPSSILREFVGGSCFFR